MKERTIIHYLKKIFFFILPSLCTGMFIYGFICKSLLVYDLLYFLSTQFRAEGFTYYRKYNRVLSAGCGFKSLTLLALTLLIPLIQLWAKCSHTLFIKCLYHVCDIITPFLWKKQKFRANKQLAQGHRAKFIVSFCLIVF